eukprot:scaffold8437_cov99-Isochrysis_galbana.AAC.4
MTRTRNSCGGQREVSQAHARVGGVEGVGVIGGGGKQVACGRPGGPQTQHRRLDQPCASPPPLRPPRSLAWFWKA